MTALLGVALCTLAPAAHAAKGHPCGPQVTAMPGGVRVQPSGDRTGVADRDAIACAFEAVPRGGVVELAGGEFFLSGSTTTRNFYGALRGAGRDHTLLHTVEGFEPGVAPWGAPFGFVVIFAYDEPDAAGSLTVADLTLIVDGPTQPWADGDDYAYAATGIHVMYTGERPELFEAAIDLDVTFEGLGAIGDVLPEEHWGSSLWFAFSSEIETSGRVLFRDIVSEGATCPAFVAHARDAEIVVGGPDASDRIVASDAFFGSLVEAVAGCDVTMSNIEVDGAVAGVSYQAYGGLGNDVVMQDNRVRNVIVGVEYVHGRWEPGDKRPPSTALITRNTIEGGIGDGIVVLDESTVQPTPCSAWTESWPRMSDPQPAGPEGEALGFWGWNGGVVVPDAPELDLDDAFTLAGWIQVDDLDGRWPKLVCKSLPQCGPPWHAWCLGVSGWGAPVVEATIDGQGQALFADDPVEIGTWTHLATTYDGSKLKLYVNGRLASSTRVSGSLEQTDTPLTIARSWNCGDELPGSVDEVRVYPDALSARAVVGLMNGPGLRGGEVAYWSGDAATLSDSDPQTVADLSGNALDGLVNPICPDEPTTQVTVSHNTIDWNSADWGGIWGLGAQDLVIENNTIRGTMFAGIYLSIDGEPFRNCRVKGNNVQGVVPVPSPEAYWLPEAPILLGEGTRDCRVVANPDDVIDLGTDNRITGR